MTPFNIPRKQLILNYWMPSPKKRRYIKKLKASMCKDCWMGFEPFEVEWDKIEQGDSSKARCKYCKQCLAKNCCPDCGYDFADACFDKNLTFNISEGHCGHCRYLNKWGPNGYEYLEAQEERREREKEKYYDPRDID